MDTEKIIKGKELLDELKELKKFKEIFSEPDYKSSAHFEFRDHYGGGANTVTIKKKHNDRFLELVKTIIIELDEEIKQL